MRVNYFAVITTAGILAKMVNNSLTLADLGATLPNNYAFGCFISFFDSDIGGAVGHSNTTNFGANRIVCKDWIILASKNLTFISIGLIQTHNNLRAT